MHPKKIVPIFVILLVLGVLHLQNRAIAGPVDSAFEVDVFNAAKACIGTTLLADNHDRERPRIVELNMKGDRLGVSPTGKLKTLHQSGF